MPVGPSPLGTPPVATASAKTSPARRDDANASASSTTGAVSLSESTADSSARITLAWLVSVRWVLIGLLAVPFAASAFPSSPLDRVLGWLPSRPDALQVGAVLLVWSGVNLASLDRLRRRRIRARTTGFHLLIDISILTWLLCISGGATNPFTTLYFVPIMFATHISPRWTWGLAAYSLASFALLFVLVPVPPAPPGHEAHFQGHLHGMWFAFGVTGALVTHFVHRIALSITRQSEELERLRGEALVDRHLAALGALATGAAHELGTPLGTITVLTADLDAMDPAERREATQTIREQVKRCTQIVRSIANPEAVVHGFAEAGLEPWDLRELEPVAREAARELGLTFTVTEPSEGGHQTNQPREVLTRIVRELVHNAARACRAQTSGIPHDVGIRVRVAGQGEHVCIIVDDDGGGMSPNAKARAFDPFFSGDSNGGDMGLGLYLARAHVRQLGGSIALDNTDRGTTVRLELPRWFSHS